METEVNDIWHVYSDGARADIPFGSEEGKITAWNSIAVCAGKAGVSVWVATVNDTHLHALVRGSRERAEGFVNSLEHRLGRMFPEDKIILACRPVTSRTEVLSTFMYVYRNSLDFYRKLPGEYPWGSGNIYFSEVRPRGQRLADLSRRQQVKLLRTKARMPEEWRVDADGKILPESFIDVDTVERFFGSVRAFIAFLYVRKEDEAAMKQQFQRQYLEHRSIQELRKIGNRLCANYTGRFLKYAPLEVRLKVASRMLKEGITTKSPSLAKAVFLTPEDLNRLL